ncbi:MAG: VIT1/CCC1 transporter family protein [Candidatus Bathyarchaeales archaeon]
MKKAVTEKFEVHYLMESVAFGLTDGIICFLGIIVGVARATLDPNLVIIAGIVGGVADALGNSVGFFVSQSTERAVQIYGVELGTEGRVHSKKEVRMSGVFSFIATIIALFFLISPFRFIGDIFYATIVSFIIGILLAFILGSYVGKLTKENQYKSGLKYAAITIAGALISYFIGEALHIII